MCSTQSQLFPWEEFQAQDNMGFFSPCFMEQPASGLIPASCFHWN